MEQLTTRAVLRMVIALLSCLGVQSRPTTVSGQSVVQLENPNSNSNIHLLRDHVHCLEPHTSFYTPLEVTDECIPAALQCVMAELSGVVELECEDPDHYVDGQLEFLEKMTEMMPRDDDKTTAGKCQCELWHQRDFHTFLNATETLIQNANAYLRT